MVKIITDTTSCLPEAVQRQFAVPVVPQIIHFGEDSYTEGVDIDSQLFLKLLRGSSQLPKTSAPPPEFFKKIFSSHNDPKEPIVCIHPSAELSGTVRSAETARLDFPELDIRVIDTRLVASPLGVIVHQAARMASEGYCVDKICQKAEDLSRRCRIYFLVATLEYLARGGRIGGAAALLGNALQIKPILTVRGGIVEQHSKERTLAKAIAKIKALVTESHPAGPESFLTIMHADNQQLASDLADYFVRTLQIEVPLISNLPPAIITHAGPGSVAAAFFVS